MGAPRANPVAYLADMIARAHARPTRFAMVWAYFDETIVHEQSAGGKLLPSDMLVGGCSASAEKWNRFEAKWKRALKDEKVSAFHAKDFYAFRKEFEWFKDGERDLDRHGAFRDRLADIITAHVDEAVVFTSQISLKNNGKIRQSYTDAVLRAMHRFTWSMFGEGGAHVIFARHPELSPWTVLKYFERLNWDNALLGCGVFDPREVIPLQAADFVCHASNKSWGGIQSKSDLRLIEGFRKRGKPYRVQLGSSWNPAEVLGGQPS